MQSKRKPANAGPSKMNFRPNSDPSDASKGTKPTADRSSVLDVLLSIFLFGCRKFMFINTFYRVLYYLALTFLVSVVMDFLPANKVSIVRKDSFLNKYFVKVGWGWTLLLALPFIVLTSFVHSCGKRDRVVKSIGRLVVATLVWYFVTNSFIFIESIYGRCNVKTPSLQNKPACLGKGHFWSSVDISGHTFILIYSTLILIEESRVINNWEGISDFLRYPVIHITIIDHFLLGMFLFFCRIGLWGFSWFFVYSQGLLREEEHTRTLENCSLNLNPLRVLNEEELRFLKNSYAQFTPYIRGLFASITGLTLIWEFMLWGTVIYYHSMLEKFLAALFAISAWYFTYYIWFPNNILLARPGEEGCFKYAPIKPSNGPIGPNSSSIKARKSFRRGSGVHFMGMPVRPTAAAKEEESNSQPIS